MMTGMEFRLKCLTQNLEKFDGKRIALYGTADNAKAIIHNFPEQNIIALLDKQHTGEYIFGKKVLSLEEAALLRVEVIIIAAEAASSQIVSERIFSFCQANMIRLLNMYGMDEMDLKNQLLLQEVSYTNFREEDLFQQIMRNEVVCFQLMDVLCASKYFGKEDFLKDLENYCGIYQMAKKRVQAEEMIDRRSTYGISNIYKNYQSITSAAKEEIQQLQLQEERLFIDGIIPRTKMVDMLNRAYSWKKKIFIVSDLHYSKEMVEKLLKKIGVCGYHGLIQENLLHTTMPDGALRRGLADAFKQKVLYIGIRQSCNIMLAQVYHMDVCVVKDAWEMLWQISDLHVKKTDIPDEKRTDFSEWVQKAMNSPFPREYVKQAATFKGRAGKHLGFRKKKRKNLELFPLPQYNRIQDLEILEFPIYKRPAVSVVIPVYNQFGYTYNCLKSILYNTGNVEYEVIVADDGSTDDTVRLDSLVKGVKILRNKENLLFLRNCNHAASQAKGKYLIFLNNDTQVQCNWMKPLVQLLDSRQDAGMAGSKLLFPDGTLQEAGGIIWQDGTGANYGRGDDPDAPEYNYVKEADYISGASIIVRKDLWNEIGGFDERFAPAYCEDSDLAFEIRRRGKKVLYQPASEVVHFEGISNGTDVSEGIKSYQVANMEKLRQKWETVLSNEQYQKEDGFFCARERKRDRKTIVMFSEGIPTYDCDAGSKTIYSYLQLFLEKGYIIKFVPNNFRNVAPYTYELQQMGIEVLYGEYYEKNIDMWIMENQDAIEYAFINFPGCGERFIDVLKCASIEIRYYGVDLHCLRKKREYEVTKNPECLQMLEKYYEMEKNILEKADVAYYPSEVEVQIVKEEFGTEAKHLSPFIYELDKELPAYKPEKREGVLFVGGFNHPPNADAVLWFVREIYPHICKVERIPFYIAGSNAPVEIQNLKEAGIIHKGYVTEAELQELYRKVRMVVVPLRYGAGIKGKVVDAMYQGVPMVATSVGIEGIPEAEKYVETADNAESFAKKVIALYRDTEKLIEISANYRDIIHKYYSKDAAWKKIKDDFGE